MAFVIWYLIQIIDFQQPVFTPYHKIERARQCLIELVSDNRQVHRTYNI